MIKIILIMLFVPVVLMSTANSAEKYYYIGKDGIASGWVGPWPEEQIGSIDHICETMLDVETGLPVDVSYLARHSNL